MYESKAQEIEAGLIVWTEATFQFLILWDIYVAMTITWNPHWIAVLDFGLQLPRINAQIRIFTTLE